MSVKSTVTTVKLNLGKYLERIGIDTMGRQPVLLDTVQPILNLGDLSHLVGPLPLTPYLVGAVSGPFATNYSGFKIVTSVPIKVRFFCTSLASAASIFVTTGPPPAPNLLNEVQVFPQSLSANPITPMARYFLGEMTIAPVGTLPNWIAPTANTAIFNDPFEIPGGSWMIFQCSLQNAAARFAFSMQELPTEID